MSQFAALENKIGYTFTDSELLRTALTHTSFANEHHWATRDNERLEFLGDSILSFVVAEYLYKRSNQKEGVLTQDRAQLVCEASLFKFASEVGLGEFILLGRGEEQTGGRNKPSVLADCFEAVIAAIFLDGGIKQASEFIHRTVLKSAPAVSDKDYKTLLQEVIQKNPEERLRYRVASESGPDHDKHFKVEVLLNSNVIGEGEGHSKKTAEQQAAQAALKLMGL